MKGTTLFEWREEMWKLLLLSEWRKRTHPSCVNEMAFTIDSTVWNYFDHYGSSSWVKRKGRMHILILKQWICIPSQWQTDKTDHFIRKCFTEKCFSFVVPWENEEQCKNWTRWNELFHSTYWLHKSLSINPLLVRLKVALILTLRRLVQIFC